MQRLADLQHDVVGGIDNVVDRAHAGQAQAALHPVGAGTDLDIPDQAQREARVVAPGW